MEGLRKRPDGKLVVWSPQPRQANFIGCPCDDVAFGGARGGGKSDAVIGDWINHEHRYGQDAIGLAFRRERTQLVELIERAKTILTPLGFTWGEQDKQFRGPKGGRLRFAYLERDADADAYQGHSYTRLYPEEMGTFPSEAPINKLQATLRSGNGVPCQMKGTMNPGGAGHSWVKNRYRLDTYPRGFEVFEFLFTNPFTHKKVSKRRVFIPSRLSDNKYLGDDYVASLMMVGSDTLVRAWLEGDWDAIEGAFFDHWRSEKHVVRPFDIPGHWLRFRSFDWGYGAPFSVGWWAVASEPSVVGRHGDGGQPRVIPRGALIRYREWYGAASANVGLRLEAEDIARGIIARETGEEDLRGGSVKEHITHAVADNDRGGVGGRRSERIVSAVADTQIFAQEGQAYGYKGPTIGERINRTLAAAGHQPFLAADKSRKQGWDQLRARLRGDLDGNPMLVVFDTCADFIRTVPVLQHDPLKPEDLDTDSEDHIADEARYACMARPWAAPTPKPEGPVISTAVSTLADLVKATLRRKNNRVERI